MRSSGRMAGVADLQGACVRMLARAARAAEAGSRRELRAAVRRFVRRHRRDAGYLRRVVRSVAASSALALTLLGLGAGTASAAATLFGARAGAANPRAGLVVGYASSPGFADLDGDGDLDLVAGENLGSFSTYYLPEPLRGRCWGRGWCCCAGSVGCGGGGWKSGDRLKATERGIVASPQSTDERSAGGLARRTFARGAKKAPAA